MLVEGGVVFGDQCVVTGFIVLVGVYLGLHLDKTAIGGVLGVDLCFKVLLKQPLKAVIYVAQGHVFWWISHRELRFGV